MTKQKGRKLTVSSERMRNLSTSELTRVAGGDTTQCLETNYCQSNYCSALTQCATGDCAPTILKTFTQSCNACNSR